MLALAEDLSLISVEGLSFECPTCRKTDASHCQVQWQGKTLSVLCDSLFEVLLQNAHEENSQKYPKNEELLTFISRKEIDSGLVGIAFDLLSKRQAEQKFLDSSLDLLISKHPEVIKEGIDKKTFKEAVKLSLWERRSHLSITEGFQLAKILPGKGLDAFLQDLSVVDIEQDSRVLTELLKSNVSVGLDSEVISNLLQFIEDCSQTLSCENISPLFGVEATKYVFRLQNSLVSKAIIEGKVTGLMALDLLTKTKYLDHRTPETHQALISLLTEFGSIKDSFWGKLSLEQRDFVSFMSKNDSRIAELVYNRPSLWSWIDLSIGVGLSILASGFVLFWFTRRKTNESFSETIAFKKDLEELNAIWLFFNLSPNSNLRDLKRRYREMARELHPDSGRESSTEFVTLNDYYKRAIELLKQ